MKNKKITRKISQGMYVLTTKNAGCVVDAVSQVSASDNPLISVAVLKNSNTNEALQVNEKFALSVLGNNVDGSIIEIFGMNSMRDINKFERVETEEIDEIKIIKDSLGYMLCEIVDVIDTGTHNLYIGKLVEADVFLDEEPMTYRHYQEHKDELIKITTETNKTAWVCTVCGYVYYGEEIPEDYTCPLCNLGKEYFVKK